MFMSRAMLLASLVWLARAKKQVRQQIIDVASLREYIWLTSRNSQRSKEESGSRDGERKVHMYSARDGHIQALHQQ